MIAATFRNTVAGALGSKKKPIPLDAYVPQRAGEESRAKRRLSPDELRIKALHLQALMKAAPPPKSGKSRKK